MKKLVSKDRLTYQFWSIRGGLGVVRLLQELHERFFLGISWDLIFKLIFEKSLQTNS